MHDTREEQLWISTVLRHLQASVNVSTGTVSPMHASLHASHFCCTPDLACAVASAGESETIRDGRKEGKRLAHNPRHDEIS